MPEAKNVSVGMKILSVILGTLLGGFMWRCRGCGGFGSSWGLYSVGLVLIMLIFVFYGNRKGMKFEKIPVAAFLMGLGVTGYATVMDQTAGLLYSDLPYQGEVIYGAVNRSGGMIIFVIMGFTLVPLFAFFVTSLFSDKEYKLKHYLITVAIFFAVSYICKASVAHFILRAINPEQVNYAALGLADSGFDYSSPMVAYLRHFGMRKWTQEIPFFENYYMSVEHISDFIAIIAITLYAFIGRKDRITGIASLVIDAFTALGTTFFIQMYDMTINPSLFEGRFIPRCIAEGGSWGFWEYSTGACVGFITMLVIALLPDRLTSQTEPDMSPVFENKKISFVFNAVLTVFIFSLTPWRAIGIRTGKLLKKTGVTHSTQPAGYIIMIAGALILGAVLVLLLRKNMLKNDGNAFNREPSEFAKIALPSYVVLCLLLYFVLDGCIIATLPYSAMKTEFVRTITNGTCMEPLIMILSFVVSAAVYVLALRKHSEK